MARPVQDVKKDSRINLAVRSELKSSLEKLSAIDTVSVNALIETVLTAYVEKRKNEVSEYDAALKKIRENGANKKSAAQVNSKDADDND